MELSSGFFISPSDVKKFESSDFELIHSSDNGFFQIYRGNIAGKYRVFKALKPEYRGVSLYEDLLKKEYEIGCQLDHPNIRHYFGYHSMDGLGRCIEMEWIDGDPLDAYVRMDRKTSVKVVCELCDALSYIHSKQIIHRDLKPSNVLVTHNGSNVKLIDFGFSDADWYALLKTPAGTLSHAAPELVLGAQIDCRSDIYSLGIIIKSLLPDRRGVAARCMKHFKEDRYGSAQEVKDAVCQKKTWPWIVALSVFVLAVAAAFMFLRPERPVESMEPLQDEAVTIEQDTTVLSIEDVFEEATQMIMEASDD